MPTKPPTFRSPGYKRYDETRPTERARGYTKRWSNASANYKAAHPLCLGCQAVGRVTATEVTDHIVPHKNDAGLLWDQANWQPACGPHHRIVKQALEQLYAAGQATAQDLRLDSPQAVELTRRLLAKG